MRLVFSLLVLLTSGCINLTGVDPVTGLPTNGAFVQAPSETPNILGTLSAITTSTDGGTLTVERDPASTAGVPRATLKLTPRTLLIRPDGQRMSFRELSTGQSVEAWFEGEPTAGDPVQATARAVRLVR